MSMTAPDTCWIGVDESGKGDYFGPLVIAAVCVETETAGMLRGSGVKDSKTLSDRAIADLAPDIQGLCRTSVVAIGPAKYNELYGKFKNLNKLLGWGHARAIENLLEAGCPATMALSDQFGDERFIRDALLKKGRAIRLEQRHRAEEDVAVAAASIGGGAGCARRGARAGPTHRRPRAVPKPRHGPRRPPRRAPPRRATRRARAGGQRPLR